MPRTVCLGLQGKTGLQQSGPLPVDAELLFRRGFSPMRDQSLAWQLP